MERDAALDRLGRARRWIIVAAAALTAGFAALVSAVAPGRSLGHTRTPAAPRQTAAAAAVMPPVASPSELGLQGPNEAPAPAQSTPAPQAAPQPQPVPQPAPAVSGGS
jgi:hypothetical protein